MPELVVPKLARKSSARQLRLRIDLRGCAERGGGEAGHAGGSSSGCGGRRTRTAVIYHRTAQEELKIPSEVCGRLLRNEELERDRQGRTGRERRMM